MTGWAVPNPWSVARARKAGGRAGDQSDRMPQSRSVVEWDRTARVPSGAKASASQADGPEATNF